MWGCYDGKQCNNSLIISKFHPGSSFLSKQESTAKETKSKKTGIWWWDDGRINHGGTENTEMHGVGDNLKMGDNLIIWKCGDGDDGMMWRCGYFERLLRKLCSKVGRVTRWM